MGRIVSEIIQSLLVDEFVSRASHVSVCALFSGNDVLHEITKQKNYKLRVDLEDFENAKRFAVYSLFSVADSSDRYKLSLGTYTGNAGEFMDDLSKIQRNL